MPLSTTEVSEEGCLVDNHLFYEQVIQDYMLPRAGLSLTWHEISKKEALIIKKKKQSVITSPKNTAIMNWPCLGMKNMYSQDTIYNNEPRNH